MARGPVRESVMIAGRPERVAVAQAFAAAVLGQHPAGETAVLLLSELVTNSVRHSASGLPGRTVTVTVLAAGEVIRAEVADRSGVTVPALRPGGSGLEGGGRGLYLVDSLAARWGFERDDDHITTWSSFGTADHSAAQYGRPGFRVSVPSACRISFLYSG